MRTFLTIVFTYILTVSYAQSHEVLYAQLQEVAKDEICDSVIFAFNKWIAKEQCLDSLQRAFIDKDLAVVRKKDCWKCIDDSLKQRFLKKNRDIILRDIGYELWKMGAEDQKYRSLAKYIHSPRPDDPEYKQFMEKQLHDRKLATEKVYSLIKKYGWLGYELVGEEAETACFYIIQHNAYPIQEKCLPLLKKAVKKGLANPYHYAMMYDRILFQKKSKQLYGTQLRRELGAEELNLIPIKNEKNVNKRRSALGLRPLEEDLYKKWGIIYQTPYK